MNKGHTEKEIEIVNKFNEYKEFIKDKHLEFVIKKTERIVYGVYLLSNFIPADEILHGDLKKTSHSILSTVSEFPQTTGIKVPDIDRVHGQLQYLSSLLSLCYLSGYVSDSNVETFKNEINYLHKHVEELSTKSVSETQHVQLKQDLFVVGTSRPTKPKTEARTSLKDMSEVSRKPVSFIKDTHAHAVKHPQSKAPAADFAKEERENKIMAVIRDRGIVSIKDISSVVFDVGEKTIQRTLQVLIDKGQVKKEGERRWAKYQLV